MALPRARRLDVAWHTLWDALEVRAERRADDPAWLFGVESLGVDEHSWRPGKFGAGREVTGMVELTRDAKGQVRARLLDLVLGRSGPAYTAWPDARQPEFRAQIESAALDPFRGYTNALRDSLSDALQVWTASTSSSSAPRSSTRSAAACSRNSSAGTARAAVRASARPAARR